MILDTISNYSRYSLGTAWDAAFEYLQSLTEDVEEGETRLDGDRLFARVMSYAKIEEIDPNAILEAHRDYADIHMTLKGCERIARYDVDALLTKVDYDGEKDAEFFEYENPAPIQLSMEPGMFTLLLPQDAHMPMLHTGVVGEVVKKVVVKVRLDALDF
tara:strand:+ start:134 stop:610 length:477 start_codon:yes stop_codon:yes gene_type:complete